MFVPTLLAETRPDVLWELMRQNPLGTIVVGGDQLDANHLPFEIDRQRNTLQTHASRSNDLARCAGENALVIFQGPNHYISPGWQPGRARHGRVAPSWNYAVVHAYGRINLIDDERWLLKHLDALAKPHEAHRTDPWDVSSAPADFVGGLIKRIIGIEIHVDRLIGKSQACQQYNAATREGVIAGLKSEGSAKGAAMANIVAEASTPRSTANETE
ncbi:FMN-binding negative transcriptional regulator [Bradyrhizobium sp. 199]|uniref:FMN-binding negative transcriptional regulator n=1 Tax=Bradyrhizobium sp. 199 TaxID=2782664 RepID=UPI001FF852A5|nr:FMN-binding negative transcriptional regulator [Bradyrhizobium sp. 199]MCK1357681.1 FMN-binding negative transcriptional regulator [Bradyrhizobium sp. 199]